MIRVLVAEDSQTVRELLVSVLVSDPEIVVVGQARNGEEAIALAVSLRPDVVTMDVQMPVMDGLMATKEIMVRRPTPIVIVSSSADVRRVELALDATRAGALGVLALPRPAGLAECARRHDEWIGTVKALSQVKVVRQSMSSMPSAAPSRVRAQRARVDAIAITASTGGPAAIQRILEDLPEDFPVPVLVVQHLSAGFVDGFARWLGTASPLRVKVAEDAEPLVARTVYVAPADRQFGVRHDRRVSLTDAAPINGCRPSGTYLFESAAREYGAGVVAVILTGMGDDGVEGLRAVRAAGGFVLAQDVASSVVYGMPAAAVAAGTVDVECSLNVIGPSLVELASGGLPAGAPRRAYGSGVSA